jgi:serine/threonine protein kinase
MQTPPSATSSDTDLAGRTLAGYRLLRLLGSGGMAHVYLAEQESLQRHVAVKLLRQSTLAHPAAVERFMQEARAAASLAHGNIVQIHEVACCDGIHFLAEEYVAGPSLKDWLKHRGPLDTAQLLSVLAQVGSALARAAEHGIIHRDIKPENLLVTPQGEVKVADFGLARVLHENLELTQTGMTLGTPLYMSPEQATGRPVDIRSDLYSLGATTYHLATGQPPFQATSSVTVALAHLNDPLPAVRGIRPELPQPVASIIEQLLAKQPGDRFSDPLSLLRSVEEAKAWLGSGPRHGALPLAWHPQTDFEGRFAASRTGASAAEGTKIETAGGGRVRGPESVQIRAATQRLQAALAREEINSQVSRRVWAATAVLALAGFALAFFAARSRPRGSRLFRRNRS